MSKRSTLLIGGGLALTLLLAACGNGNDGETNASSGGDRERIVFWTQHTAPKRMEIQEQVAADFTAKTGIEVEVVGLDTAGENQALIAAAASGDMPDVVAHMPDQAAVWAEQGLLDTEAAREVVDHLGEETFSQKALDLVTVDGELQAVPSDGWGELLYYRTDLFEAAGLDAPTSIADVAEAAATINESGTTGIVLGTAPGVTFTTQVIETIGLMNGCQMFEGSQIALDSTECVNALAEYQKMVAASVPGDQDVDSTRAAYLAGKAGMVFWSTHLLDELAGLDTNFPVSCAECTADPQWLAKNTGVVGLLSGPDSSTATTYGLTMNLGIMTGAQTDAAKQWVEYMLSDGYIEILSSATEGRVPVRTGTADEPNKYVDEWRALPLGVDESLQLPFDSVYSAEVLDQIVEAANEFTRWGLGTENAGVAGTLASQNALAEDAQALFSGADPETVAQAMQSTAEMAMQDAGK